jgi:hypothetical protein
MAKGKGKPVESYQFTLILTGIKDLDPIRFTLVSL